jgi:UrcA family protein
MSRSMLCAALLSAVALTSGNVHAQTLETAQRTVSAKGVNFEDMKQVRFFYSRLNLVAKDVCHSDYSDPLTAMADAACANAAVADAVSQVDKPLLNRMNGQRKVELIAGNTSAGTRQPALLVSGFVDK